ncbi:MAG: hypothetical protein JWP95_1508, partial [Actinotalea sp.]|nr:hypothetical protein [Actinotalea sp.]
LLAADRGTVSAVRGAERHVAPAATDETEEVGRV